MDELLQSIRQALRSVRKTPVVTITIVLTLALVIGVNTSIFSVIDAVLLKPLPYPNSERIVTLWERKPNGQPNSMTTLNYLDYAAEASVFDKVAATTTCCGYMTLAEGGTPAMIVAEHVSAPYFDIFGIRAALGRTFLPGDDREGRDRVLVMSHALWASRFGADPDLVGRAIHLDGEAYTVIGVLPETAASDRSFAQIWTPLAFTAANTSRNTHWLISFTGAATGLLKPDVSLEQARAKLGAVADRIARDHPDTNKGWGVVVNAYAAEVVGRDTKQSLYLLLGSVFAVLLIGCVNLANLMLTKGLSRHRELSIRLALGASPRHLVRQVLVESLLLAAAGAALGLGVSSFAGRGLLAALRALPLDLSLSSRPIPSETIVSLDWRVAAFSMAATLVCLALFGIFPAVRAIRASRLEDAFAGGQRTTANREQGRIGSLLVVVEMTLACVLLVTAMLLIRSVGNMTRADIGFDGTRVLTAEMPIPSHRFANADAFLAFLARVEARVAGLPGVESVGFTSDEPMEPVTEGAFMQIVGRPYQVRAERPTPLLKIVSAAYFPTIGLRHQQGRVLNGADRAGTPLVAIINDTLARTYFEGHDAVGQHVMLNAGNFDSVQVGAREDTYEIVGVVADERVSSFGDAHPHPIIYLSNEQHPSLGASNLVIRTVSAPAAIAADLGRAVADVDSTQALWHVRTIDQLRDDMTAPDWFRSVMVAAFSAMALLLAALGVYGVMAYSVESRRHEMGIRLALGASAANVVGLIVGGAMRLALAGLVAGSIAGIAVARLLRAFLFGVGPLDGLALTATAAILAGTVFVASLIPSRRAAHVDPLEVLRTD